MTNPVAQKKQLPAFLVLTIISLIAAIVLAATNAVTKGPIAEHAARARREAFGAVLQADDYQEMEIPAGHDAVSALYKAVDKDGNELGYTVVASFKGYAGPVAVTLGVGADGKVTGAVIGDNSFVETAGFGKRWQEETDRLEQFKQIDTVEGGSIEAISGVTLTSNAILNATNAAINCVNEVRGIDARDVVEKGVPKAPEAPVVELTGGIHEGNARGFQSDVRVQLTMDDAGVVTGLAIDSSGETVGFGTRAMTEPAFAEQFVGKSAPFAAGENIDVLSGATITSKAVVDAVNMACAAPENPDAVPFGQGAEEEPAEDLAVEVSAEPVVVGEPVAELTGTAKGFQSDVTVTVSLDANNLITGVVINSANETPNFGTRCGEDAAFAEQFIGKTIPVENFDALSGATVTSNAVVAAINSTMPVEEPVVVGEPVAELTGTAKGFQSDVTVTVSLDANNLITGVVINSANETPNFGTRCGEDAAFAEQFIGKTIPVENFDALSGATVTSNAVVAAINAAVPAEVPAEEAAPAGDSITGTAKGFASDVTVTLTVDENNVITGIQVDSSNETPGFGTRCGEDEAFLAQFIGKKATPDLGEGIEALSGATVTSNAVITAANAAIGVAEAVEIPAEETVAVGEPVAELTGTAKGFQSDVTVTVSLDANSLITGVVIDSANETAGFGTRCGEDAAFAEQFIGKTIPVESFDVLSGATVTSNAVVAAINAAAPAVEETVEAPAAEVLTAAAAGFMAADVGVAVTLNEDGTIATLEIDVSNQLPPVCDLVLADNFVNQFIGKKGPFVKGENVDIVSGATFTSDGVINALNTLFPAEEVVEAPAADDAAAIPTDDMSVTGEEGPAAPVVVTLPAYADKDITVTVTFAADGTVETLAVDASTQSPGLGKKCAEESFIEQFIGGSAPFVLGEGIDAVSYATVTSQAVVDAVNQAAQDGE